MPCAWHFIDASISLSSLPCEVDIFTFVLLKRKPRFRELPGFPMVLQLVVVVIEKFVEMVEVVVEENHNRSTYVLGVLPTYFT